jgi:hypothetical protein
MLVYPLSQSEQRLVVWGGRFIMLASLLAIGLLGAVSLSV